MNLSKFQAPPPSKPPSPVVTKLSESRGRKATGPSVDARIAIRAYELYEQDRKSVV